MCFFLRECEWVFHTNTQYSTVEADCIPHGVCTHLQYKINSVLKGLWVGLSILLDYVSLDREVVKKGGEVAGKEKGKIAEVRKSMYVVCLIAFH